MILLGLQEVSTMRDGMELSREFDEYLDNLTKVIGHLDRHEPLRKYCTHVIRISPTSQAATS